MTPHDITNDPVALFIALFFGCIVLSSLAAAASLFRDWLQESSRRYFAGADAAIGGRVPQQRRPR